jgi:methylated-DNA-[protein]-cysteine S-methyltransferase
VNVALASRRLEGPFGPLVVTATATGATALTWGDGPAPAHGGDPTVEVVLDQAAAELDEYFAGRRRAFDVPVDLRGITGFRRAVIDELARVAYGTVVTYGELAARAGRPRAARAVGRAMATNPLPIILPCHRVLAAGGGMGGYSGGHGLETKHALLSLEGALGG